jgi:hypothetical protein
MKRLKLGKEVDLLLIQVPSRALGWWGIKIIKVNNKVALLKSGNFNQRLQHLSENIHVKFKS